MGGYKQRGHIGFDFSISLNEFIKHAAYTNLKYELAAVIEHSGSLQSGHYTAYKKLKWGEGGKITKWVYTSDESVHYCTTAQVAAAEAYMLFYERLV